MEINGTHGKEMQMKQYRLVICDREEEYSLGVMNYINRDDKNPYMAVAFSKLDKFKSYLEQNQVHCMVVNRKFQREFQTSVPILWVSDSKVTEQEDLIYKYQSMETLCQGLNRMMREQNCYHAEPGEIQIYGVYSPMGRTGKTTFALALCNHLNKRGRSLYLGFEEYSSFSEGQKEASDLLYFIKSHSPDMMTQLTSRLLHRGQLDIFPSPIAYMDIRQLTMEDMIWFVEQLRQQEQYQSLVFDIGAGSFSDLGVLQLMDHIYMPVLSEGFGEKEQNFRRMLELMQLSYLEERIEPVYLETVCHSEESMEGYVEELVG
jgi:hypothetical protein